jgi:methyl-accepting chemotaxis protein
MKLAHKIIMCLMVLVAVSGVFSSAVFYSHFKHVSELFLEPSPDVESLVSSGKTIALAVGLLSLLLGSLVTFVLIKQIATPVKAINLALKEHLENGKLVKINIPNRDELGILAWYVNKLITREDL